MTQNGSSIWIAISSMPHVKYAIDVTVNSVAMSGRFSGSESGMQQSQTIKVRVTCLWYVGGIGDMNNRKHDPADPCRPSMEMASRCCAEKRASGDMASSSGMAAQSWRKRSINRRKIEVPRTWSSTNAASSEPSSTRTASCAPPPPDSMCASPSRRIALSTHGAAAKRRAIFATPSSCFGSTLADKICAASTAARPSMPQSFRASFTRALA
mmetsp:Transcript_13611/g.45359  ORF Transcript_13611/g.45359 Transcript_13611/m.45359 type:complete len:211 (-) Transcript_13611:523-1155(-)